MKIHSYYFSHQKRIFDLALAGTLLLVLSPLLLLIGLAVLLTAGWPVIFKQKRTGKDGKTFTLFKFRTMQKNAVILKYRYQHLNEAPEPMFKIRHDPRFVGIGKSLAKAGLDELPQLWNIFKGEMSFVGPRPLPVKEAVSLPTEWRAWRERVKPGVFSQWAFSGEKHQSLEKWRKLEEKTLQTGASNEDIKQALLSLKAIVLSFFNR